MVNVSTHRVPTHPGALLRKEFLSPLAQFFGTSSGLWLNGQMRREWTLYWCDRNLKFHLYDRAPPTKSIQDLLDEVTIDPTHSFWG